MKYLEYKSILKCDRDRYSEDIGHFRLYFLNPCYKITTRYRKCKLFSSSKILKPIYIFERLIYNHVCIKYGCDIPSHVEIGPGFRMDHPHGVVINSKVRIGSNFTIKSGAVIGANDKGIPVIGDNVLIGVHALIIGPVKLGNDVKVGAGAIVVHDIPDNSTVICEAAHIR